MTHLLHPPVMSYRKALHLVYKITLVWHMLKTMRPIFIFAMYLTSFYIDYAVNGNGFYQYYG